MLKKEYFKNQNLILLFFMIFSAYIFSVVCRFYWVFWASQFNEYFFNNQLMITSNDGYAFAEGARDMIAGFHQPNDLSYFNSPLSTLTYWIYKLSPFSFETIILYMSVFLSSLIIIPLVLIANEYKRPLAGFVAALLASIANSYYNRTMAGYYDTDMLVIVLPLFILFFMIRLVLRKDLLSFICLPFIVMIYLWWYPSSYTLNVALIGCFLLYALVFHRKETIFYMSIILMLITLSNIAWFYQSAIIVLLFCFYVFKNEYFKLKFLIILGILTLIFLILSGGVDPILYQLKFYIFRSDESSNLTQGFVYFNVNQTIQEVESIDLSVFMKRISANEITFCVSMIGLVWLIINHKSMILTLPMLFLGFLALKGGLRFTIYAVPILALGFGFLICSLREINLKKYDLKVVNTITALVVFLSLIPTFFHIYIYKAPTVFSQNEAKQLDQLKKIANREDYVVAWWDYGYPIRYYSDVKTLVDGGKHLGKDNFFPSFVLTKDQISAANMARLSVEYTEKSFYAPNDSLLKKDILQAMMKDYNESNVDLFLNSLSKPDFKINMPKTRDIYIYMPARMSFIFSTIASFSLINLDTGKFNQPFVFSAAYPLSNQNGEILLSNGVYLSDDFRSLRFDNGTSVDIHSFIELNSIQQNDYKEIPIDENGQYYLFYIKNSTIPYIQFILMNKVMFDSAFVQMFFLGNYDKNLFDLVINTQDAKVFKLKR
ncbi:undecaprenyl-diphosphooligosaccharide--protein glycotransferase [Campylobacter estrildidarum]|uniref:Undecaprenyl-diphosphooligosaccharide--protein glycotransferase n=1 Tax=Campylobacter estrildidarum TaxID=2510189 RepID=A0A4U7BN32_9BACT|nr:STT3 domain-containing protein [Campylobacter estrildidarum]TKX32061.1 peptide-binding protein [Campylobacter estrildidarum]